VPVQRLRIAWAVPDGTHVKKGDVLIEFDPDELNLEMMAHRSDLQMALEKITRGGLANAGEKTDIVKDKRIAELELEKIIEFLPQDEQIYKRREIIEGQLDKDYTEKKIVFADARLGLKGKVYSLDEAILMLERGRVNANIDRYEKALASLKLVSPATGIVVYNDPGYFFGGYSLMPGRVVYGGMTLFNLVNPDKMEVKCFVLEKDAGEKVQWNTAQHKYGMDYNSFHVQIMNKGRLKNLIIGDYQTQFAQGLLMGGSFGFGKGAETVTTIRRSNLGFMPYTSANEAGFKRGAAITYELSRYLSVSPFYSPCFRLNLTQGRRAPHAFAACGREIVMANVKPIPEGSHTITAGLVVKGARKAIEFYKAAFGAQELNVANGPDGKSVMHAELKIGDTKIYLGDESPEFGAVSPQTLGGSPVSLNIYTEDCDAMFKRAVAAGATVKMPLEDMFWGDRYGKITVTKTPNGENPLVHGGKPILGCDVWEHSYYIDYRNRRPDYLKAWVDHLINWDYVEELFEAATK